MTNSVPATNSVYRVVCPTAINDDPVLKVNGNTVTLNGPVSNENSATPHAAIVAYYPQCGKVTAITSANHGSGYTSASATWSSGSGGGTSLTLGTPVIGQGVTSYTITSGGSGQIDGSYVAELNAGTYMFPAHAIVTVSGGVVTAIVPASGSVFGCGSQYTGSFHHGYWLLRGHAKSSFGSAVLPVIQAHISGYLQSVPVTSSSSDFTSMPTITISGDGTSATAAPFMSGPLDTDTVTMTLAQGAIEGNGGASLAWSGAITNSVGQVEGAFGQLLGFLGARTMVAGGELGSEQTGGNAGPWFLPKNKMLGSYGWSIFGTGQPLTSLGYPTNPVSAGTPYGMGVTSAGAGAGWQAVAQGTYKLIYDDSDLGSPTTVVVSSGTPGIAIGTQTKTTSGTTCTITFTVNMTSGQTDVNTNLGVTVTPPGTTWNLSNMRLLEPNNTDTYASQPWDLDDQVVAALTSSDVTPGCGRWMDCFGGPGNINTPVDPSDAPTYQTNGISWTSYAVNNTVTISQLRRFNTNPSSPTYSWSSTKLYYKQTQWFDSGLSDANGTYLQISNGPLGANDDGLILQGTRGATDAECWMECVTSAPHGFKTMQVLKLQANSGVTVTMSQSGPVTCFGGSNPGQGLTTPCFVTSPTTFVIAFNGIQGLPPVDTGIIQTLVDTSPVSCAGSGLTAQFLNPITNNSSPAQFGAIATSRLPGCAMYVNLAGSGTAAWHQYHMGLIAPPLVSTDNEIWLEYGNEHWNTDFFMYPELYNMTGWTQYIPSGTSCFGGTYTSNSSTPLQFDEAYALQAATAFEICKSELVSLGISASRIRFIYGSSFSSNSTTNGVCSAIAAHGLPLGTVVIAPYQQIDFSTSANNAFQPAGYPGGTPGNWPIAMICDWAKAAIAYGVDNWNIYASHGNALSAGMVLGAYEGGLTALVNASGVVHWQNLNEDMQNHPAYYDLATAFLMSEQLGDPTVPGSGLVRSSWYTIWYQNIGSPGVPAYNISQGYQMPTGLGLSNKFTLAQGGPTGGDGSRRSGFASGIGATGNEAPGIKALLDWNAAITSTASTTATLSGPTSGLVSAASTNFAVTLDGTTYTGTVTPSDSSAGGTFTPASLTWSGTAQVQTFTYTAASSGAKSISISASPTLTIAGSPITYTASRAVAVVPGIGVLVGL